MSEHRFRGCIIGGAIGDAWGSSYENQPVNQKETSYYWNKQPQKATPWQFTDDTQLTLATCEALCDEGAFSQEILCEVFLKYYKERRLTGLGSSTLKALQELEAGISWRQSGRMGEYAAGNGAAMRIAPCAFTSTITKEDVYDICRITHKNDEAYAGALAIYLAIKAIVQNEWDGTNNLFELIIPQMPDTNVRDRLLSINERGKNATIAEVAKLGTNGYVVNSVPFSLFASTQILKTGFTDTLREVIECGGDTDTNASITGQVVGALIGVHNIPVELLQKIQPLKEYGELIAVTNKTSQRLFV